MEKHRNIIKRLVARIAEVGLKGSKDEIRELKVLLVAQPSLAEFLLQHLWKLLGKKENKVIL